MVGEIRRLDGPGDTLITSGKVLRGTRETATNTGSLYLVDRPAIMNP